MTNERCLGCDSPEYDQTLERITMQTNDYLLMTTRSGNNILAVGRLLYRCFAPDSIVDVEFYPPATKMIFKDGTVTTAVAQEGDEFNKEVGMMVCIMKYIFKGKGYNNMFRKWIKNADKREATKAQEIKKQEEAKAIKERQAAKEAKRRADRAERAREREIEIQKEAYVRAMREVQSDKTEGADA